jgi:tetratricopeptide (TPR) repeat protein
MTLDLVFVLLLAFSANIAPQQTGQAQAPGAITVPAMNCTTPAECVKEVRDYAAKRRQEILPPGTTATPATSKQLQQVQQERLAMARQAAARFDVKTIAEKELAGLAELYMEASQPDMAKAAIERALPLKNLAPADRAAALATAVTVTLREPKGDGRNARLEKMVDELDALPDAFIERKFAAHISLNGYYRGDDIDAGIIKHSTWILDHMKRATPAQRKTYGSSATAAYINMAEALAGQGMNDKALDLLRRAPKELSDIPDVETRVADVRARYELVGTTAAPVTAPRWLNAPPDTKTIPMTGKVTLLQFTAHWCGPCRESYPGINRLRRRFEARGFRVVLVTRYYGYFGSERSLTPEAELERDRGYFAEHHLDVPVAVGDQVRVEMQDGKVAYLPGPDPNDTAYKVGGIPQIHLIDRQGKIRNIMVGYDDANEEKLAKMIEALLK